MRKKSSSRPAVRPIRRLAPWQNVEEPLELFVSPEIKERLRLSCKTTVDYLEGLTATEEGAFARAKGQDQK